MSAKPPTEAIVNPTLVGVSAGGAAEGTRTRSGRGLVQADLLRVSANQDKVPVPTRKRLPRAAAGDAVAEAIVPEAIGATATEPVTPRRRRAGPSARKRKEARTTPQVPDRWAEGLSRRPTMKSPAESPRRPGRTTPRRRRTTTSRPRPKRVRTRRPPRRATTIAPKTCTTNGMPFRTSAGSTYILGPSPTSSPARQSASDERASTLMLRAWPR